ncbi:hypothetical protein ABPG72_011280 [Tetrahymena utriculariae]
MNGSQRYDYLGPTNIFLRNKEYERHQKKLEEIKSIRAKGTYYNKQHIEGIRVYNNIKVNNNKFKDKIKNDELQINNNKILKKIIDISRHDNGLSKTHFSQLSPRRANVEEVDKIIRENQILSNKINNVDSQLNNKKFANHYQLLYECKQRIQRFEVIDYEKNQVKLKAYDLANSTFNGGLSQAHSRLSQRKQSLNLNSNGNQDEIFENNDHYIQQEQSNSLGDTQNYHQKSQISNYKQIQITTSQNSPRENQFDSARAKSCERDRISLQRKNQQFQGQNQGYNTKDNQKENYDSQTQNIKAQRQIGTSEQARHRSVSRGRGASTRSSYEPSKNPSDSQLPFHRYFRNFKRANPERQSLNLTSNSIGYQKLNTSDEQKLNKTGESNYKNSSNKSGISSKQTNEGDFYNEEGYGYGQEEENSTYYRKAPQKLNQNYIQKGEGAQPDDKKQSIEINKIVQLDKQNKNYQIKNNTRAYSAKGTQKDKLRSITPNKNIINNSQNQGLQQGQYKEEQSSSKNTPRGLVQIEQVDRSSIQSRQNDKSNKRQFNQHSDQQVSGDNSKKISNSQQQSKAKQESNYSKDSFDIEENITSQSKQLNDQKDSKEDLNDEYSLEDEDFVQQEESYQLDDDTKKKFMNNSKNFYKDKKKVQYQIAEQEEYEDDFESQLIKSSNQHNKNHSSNQKDSQNLKVSNNQNIHKNQHKQEHDQNKFDDLESSKLNSSHNPSEIKNDKSKLMPSQLKNEIKNQQNQEPKQIIQKKTNNKISKQDKDDRVNKYEEENFELEE